VPFRKAVDHFSIPKKEVFEKWTLIEISEFSMYFGVFNLFFNQWGFGGLGLGVG
jgi:hypothetical protein